MSHIGTHMECGKAGLKAALFTASAMGAEWQRSEQITRPAGILVGYNKPANLDTAGASFQEGHGG
jgi:hypothetical protein